MFWMFRRRKPLTPAQVIDSAAGIMFARGKAHGTSLDAWGRVDVLGAIKLVIFKAAMPDSSKVRHFAEKWDRYTQVKKILVDHLTRDAAEKEVPDQASVSMLLAEWSDNSPEEYVIALLRRVAREAAHKNVVWT